MIRYQVLYGLHIFLILVLSAFFCFGQDSLSSSQVEIKNADVFRFSSDETGELRYLKGNVKLLHKGTYMECDSAVVYKETNSVDAFGHVFIIDHDSIQIRSVNAFYNGVTRWAILERNVSIRNGSMFLEAPRVDYNLNESVGYYNQSGKLTKDNTVITSQFGTYYNEMDMAYFNQNVHIKDPDFTLDTDTLAFDTKNSIATFTDFTVIKSKSSTIECNTGHYDTRFEMGDFGPNTIMYDEKQRLVTDSMWFNRKWGRTELYKSFVMTDTTRKIQITGTEAIYLDRREFFFAWNRPLLTRFFETDTLYLRADTVVTMKLDTSSKFRCFYAFPNVRTFKNDFQTRCDSFWYSFQDSTFRLFKDPVVWNGNVQLSGDTIYMTTVNQEPDQMETFENGFIAMMSSAEYFDQIKGTRIIAKIKKQQLDEIWIRGNAESIYFGKDDKNKYMGMNRAKSSEIKMWFANKELEQVRFYNKPEAVFTPIQKLNGVEKTLEGFLWRQNERPKGVYDL